MNVFVSKPLGFCHGVVRALDLVKKIALDYPKKKIYVLGQIVHNEDVIRDLKKLNVTTLIDKTLTNEQLIETLEDEVILIFTAHGHPKHYEEIAKRKKLTLFDATCPMVLSTHQLIKKELENNHQIIYIGKRLHPEAEAALSLDPNIILIEHIEDIKSIHISDSSPYVINQTTLSFLELETMHDYLRKIFPKARFANEICNATRLRQEGVFNLPKTLKLVYVIGGQNSSNTNSLVKVAKTHFTRAKILRILNVKEINLVDLENILDVGVISSASTPLEIVDEVIAFLRRQ